MSERRGTRALETWCRRVTDGYPGVKVDNMTTSWRNGLAFCALIHHFRPDLIDFNKLKPSDVYHNNNLAFRIAERHLGIPALLDAEDMVEYDVPDRLSILTYLSQFYQTFAATMPAGSQNRLVPKRPSVVTTDRSGIVTPTSASPPTKMVTRSSGVGNREPCAKCTYPVFLAERLNVGRHLYHRTCFKCARCNAQLSLANCYETETDGEFCCETCPDEDVEPADLSGMLPSVVDIAHAFDHRNRSLSDEEKQMQRQRDEDAYSAEFENILDQDTLGHVESLTTKDITTNATNTDRTSSLVQARLRLFETTDSTNLSTDSCKSTNLSGEKPLNPVIPDPPVSDQKSSDSKNSGQLTRTSKSPDDYIPTVLHRSSRSKSPETPDDRLQNIKDPNDDQDRVKCGKSIETVQDRLQNVVDPSRSSTRDEQDQSKHSKSSETSKTDLLVNQNLGTTLSKLVDDPSRPETIDDHLPTVLDRNRRSKSTESSNTDLSINENLETTSSKLVDDRLQCLQDPSKSSKTTDDRLPTVLDRSRHSKSTETGLSTTQNLIKSLETIDKSDYLPTVLDRSRRSRSSEVSNTDSSINRNIKSSVDPIRKLPETCLTTDESQQLIRDQQSSRSLDHLDQIVASTPIRSVHEIARSFEQLVDDVVSPVDDKLRRNSAQFVSLTFDEVSKPFETITPTIEDSSRRDSTQFVSLTLDETSEPFETIRSDLVSKKDANYPEELNPFGDDSDDGVPVPVPRKQKSTDPGTTNPSGKKVLAAPRISLNPFWSDGEEPSDEEHSGKPVPLPRSIKSSPVPRPRRSDASGIGSEQFGSNSSLSSFSSGISAQGTPGKKKQRAPLPPGSSLSNLSSLKSSVPLRKKPKAPAPPGLEPSAKTDKDATNRNRQSQTVPAGPGGDKSSQGKWKRRKGPAPGRPVPQRRQIKPLPVAELRGELDLIELQQQGLEKQGVRLEQLIREKCETPEASNDDSLTPEVEELVLELFELVNEKNELFRRQAELMYLRRQQRLEEEYADLEYQIRCLMERPEINKTDSDKAREEELIDRLVEVVERRNEIIECLEMDRVREAEEDESISTHLSSFTAKRDEEIRSEQPVKLSKKEKKKTKKEKKLKGKGKSMDVDKDIDETESGNITGKKRKKWF